MQVLEFAKSDEFEKVSAKLLPRFVELAGDEHGARAMQKFIEVSAMRGKDLPAPAKPLSNTSAFV